MSKRKIDKEFLLTDDSVNCYGYRLLTAGLQKESFTPSIGYLMHDREKGVAVIWEDLVVRDGALYGKPVVNELDFPNLAEQIENGFYACASVGHIVALEVDDSDALKLAGQTGLTVTKWFPRECSIVDLGGNFNANAQAKLYDISDNVLHDLSDNGEKNQIIKPDMNQPTLTASQLSLLDLSAESTTDQVSLALQNLREKSIKYDALVIQHDALKAKTVDTAVADIIAKGLADKRITVEVAESLKTNFAGNPEGLKDLVSKMPAQTVITDEMDKGKGTGEPANLDAKFKGKTYSDLYRSNDLEALQASHPEYFKQLKANR